MKEETQKEKIIRILEVTPDEADEILACDKAIDQGKRVYFDVDEATEKQALKLANATTKTAKKPREKKERPPDLEKNGIIAEIAQFLTENAQISAKNVEIKNKGREISFNIDQNSFTLTLVRHRKK
jgi:hypothetical protein